MMRRFNIETKVSRFGSGPISLEVDDANGGLCCWADVEPLIAERKLLLEIERAIEPCLRSGLWAPLDAARQRLSNFRRTAAAVAPDAKPTE